MRIAIGRTWKEATAALEVQRNGISARDAATALVKTLGQFRAAGNETFLRNRGYRGPLADVQTELDRWTTR